MAQKKYVGEEFIAGIKRNMAAQGIVPKPKPAKPIGYFSRETLKRVPGEIIPATKKVLGAVGRGALAPVSAIGRIIKKAKKPKRITPL